jgi:hypothetical protein
MSPILGSRTENMDKESPYSRIIYHILLVVKVSIVFDGEMYVS